MIALKKTIIKTVKEYVKSHNKKPQIRTFSKKNGYPFTKGDIIKNFGSFNNMLIACGLPPQKPGERQYDKEKLLKDLKKEILKNGTTNRDIVSKNLYDRSVYENLFGSWSKAVELSGIKNSDVVLMKYFDDYAGQEKISFLKEKLGKNSSFSLEQKNVISEIRKIHDKYGLVTHKLIQKEFSSFFVKKYFKHESLAIIASGLEPVIPARNKRVKAKDGHLCDSIEESKLDDFLFSLGVPHEVHAKYPESRFFVDFKISDNFFIEYAGFSKTHRNELRKDYKDRLKEKKKIAKENNIQLIIVSDLSTKSKDKIRAALESNFY